MLADYLAAWKRIAAAFRCELIVRGEGFGLWRREESECQYPLPTVPFPLTSTDGEETP